MIVRLVAVGAFVLLTATACGDEKEKEAGGKACASPPAALSARPTLLPMRFPTPTGVTYTSQKRAGPAKIVSGYIDEDVAAAFDAYGKALSRAPYAVTKSEHEEVDAEVNFGGGGSTGQVKLVQGCKDRTTITITARPG